MRMLMIAVALLTLMGSPTPAADKRPSFVFGYGHQSCGAFLTARKKGKIYEVIFTSWMQGYLTAMNLHPDNKNKVEIGYKTDTDGQLAWLDKYCRENPTKKFIFAALSLYVTLRDN